MALSDSIWTPVLSLLISMLPTYRNPLSLDGIDALEKDVNDSLPMAPLLEMFF